MVNINQIKIDDQLCKGCAYCVDICPKAVLKLADKPSARGYHIVQIISPETCISCRQCELICPEMAIYLIDNIIEGEGLNECTD